jgi:hypothetical protein
MTPLPLLYDQTLSADDLQGFLTYLAGRYGLVLVQVYSLPSLALSINQTDAGDLQFTWPFGFSNLVLEQRATQGSGAWTPVATNPPNDMFVGTPADGTQFFRLRPP